jgi:microcystin-dependent protein
MSIDTQRPPRNTPNLGLPVPGDAGPADYVTDTGALADTLDALAARLLINPGDLRLTASNIVPAGWLLCDGAAYSRGQYQALFDAIGTTYGAGDGSSTFNVPDLRGRFPLGAGPSDPIGRAAGARRVALRAEEMPVHSHSVYDPTHAHGVYDPGHAHSVAAYGHSHGVSNLAGGSSKVVIWTGGAQGQYWIAPGTGYHSTDGAGENVGIYGAGTGIGIYGAGTGVSLYNAGNGWDHENMPPHQALNYLIKT